MPADGDARDGERQDQVEEHEGSDGRTIARAPRVDATTAEQDEDGAHQAEDGPARTDRDRERAGSEQPAGRWERGQRRRDHDPGQADDAETAAGHPAGGEAEERAGSDQGLEHLAEAPQEQPVEGEVREATMEERARDQAPPLADTDEHRDEPERAGVDRTGRTQGGDGDDRDDQGAGDRRCRVRVTQPPDRRRGTGAVDALPSDRRLDQVVVAHRPVAPVADRQCGSPGMAGALSVWVHAENLLGGPEPTDYRCASGARKARRADRPLVGSVRPSVPSTATLGEDHVPRHR